MECHNIEMIVPKNEGVRWITAIANQESLLLDFDWKFLRFQKKKKELTSFSATVAVSRGGLKESHFCLQTFG